MEKDASSPRKTAWFLVLAVLTNSFGNLLLAKSMDKMPDFSATPLPHYLWLLLVNPYLLPGTFLSAVYMGAQLALFSWADLSFVVPVIASSYVATALLSEFVLGEHIGWQRWIGIGLISLGVGLVSHTRPQTRNAPGETTSC